MKQELSPSKTPLNGLNQLRITPLTKTFFFLAVVWVVIFFGNTSTQAQDKTTEVDKILNWATKETPGCTCAVSQNGKVVVNRAYGSADLEREVPLNPKSVFDIGSVRKQFIAAATLLLVEEKRLSLSEDIHKYLPELPAYGHKITLDHLLNHTSGIRDWTGLMPLANGNPDALTLILRQRGLNFKPGEEFSYSNSGYVLLVEIVTRTTGMPFAEFARQRLFEPLGMKSTAYVSDMTATIKNRALGYEKTKDGWKLDMYLGNDRGAGAILSTASDLVLWNDALTSNRLGTFVSSMLQEPAKLNNGRKLGYARGLFLETYRGVKEVWHSGGAAGYHTWLGRFPEQGISIAVLCNSDAMSATAVAERIADQFVTYSDSQKAVAKTPPALTGAALEEAKSNTGLFVNEKTGEMLRLAVDRDRFRIAGGPGLAQVTPGTFRRFGASVQYMSQDEFELHFQSPDQFELITMEGQKSRYRRVQPYTPNAADLQAFTGRYTSNELGAFFDLFSEKDNLKGRANDAPGVGFDLKPVTKDTFQLGGVTVRFVRDKAGRVTALDYSNPLIRNIRFTRQNDLTSRR
ncbi:serine hydrolase domain-containing protein [Rufibacter latericius]|uniref:Class A beta-lactamase-related serine hydrolase n=1 Tax=Rufibacter latericius TaxID=2487040 RepID=A0A3M9MDD0_9BACT|nr:serine hydrolase domain-containing protein [Rufibacter latericius]RNI23556.1 class A beta-lactamase-related serine hydrolase [Rufibacter latericius]